MRSKLTIILSFGLAFGLWTRVSAESTPKKPSSSPVEACHRCADIKKIEKQLNDSKPGHLDYDDLQLAATAIIQNMPDSKQHLSDQQIDALIGVIEASIKRDPAKAIVENNLDVIKANRAAFDKQLAKLSKTRADQVKSALETALGLEKPETGFKDND